MGAQEPTFSLSAYGNGCLAWLCPLVHFLFPTLSSYLPERKVNACLDLCIYLIVGVLHSCLSV